MIGQDKASGKERFISQCIICGILLAFMLFVSSINIPIALQLRGEIKEVLASGLAADNFSELSDGVLNSFESFRNRFLEGNNNDTNMPWRDSDEVPPAADIYNAPGSEPSSIGENASNTENEEQADSDFEIFHIEYSTGVRIDEDILNEIESNNANSTNSERFLIH